MTGSLACFVVRLATAGENRAKSKPLRAANGVKRGSNAGWTWLRILLEFAEKGGYSSYTHTAPLLHRVLGIYLPLITSNCAVLGVALLNLREQNSLVESALYGFGAALGFGLVLVALAAARERLELADVPQSFRGAPIGLITAGLMALAFMGFLGFGAGGGA